MNDKVEKTEGTAGEIVGNICVHPDFSSGYACFFEVYKDRVITRNPSRLIPMVSEGDVDIWELGN